jgi:hypothetical protein
LRQGEGEGDCTQNVVESLLIFSCCSNPVVVQIDSRLHWTYIAIHSWLGGQQWRRRERKQWRRRRQNVGRRSSLRRNRSSASHVSEIASHGPAKVEGGSTISRDGPAQVHDRGRRRDGGASFAVVLIENDGEDEGRKTRILRWRYSQRICASAISPTPSVFEISSPKLLPASWTSAAPFFFAVT